MFTLAMPALGSLGGPDLMEVLGWDPVDQKVFVAQTYVGDSGYPKAVAYLDLKGASPGRPIVVPWSVRSDGYPARYHGEMRRLRARLRPLPAVPAPSMFSVERVMSADSVEVAGERWARHHVLLTRLQSVWDGTLEVSTLRNPSVRVLSVHPIPGRRERLAIVSFLGVPYESGYETQVPVLFAEARDTVRVEWNPFRR